MVALKYNDRSQYIFERELYVLKRLGQCQRRHVNIANLLDKFEPEELKNDKFNSTLPVMVLEYAPVSLVALIERDRVPFSKLASFVLQLNEALKFLRDSRVIHRDINPANLQLTDNGILKIIDFGSAAYLDNTRKCNRASTPNVCTLWYRAPEALEAGFDGGTYTYPVDMWSAGCVLAELCTGTPIFDEDEEFTELTIIKNKDVKAHLTSRILLSNDDNELLIEIISRMLAIDPEKRITPSEVSRHEYLKINHPIPHRIYFKKL
jgi:serine/threonine protein kinase